VKIGSCVIYLIFSLDGSICSKNYENTFLWENEFDVILF
jgi:hypothetical protein